MIPNERYQQAIHKILELNEERASLISALDQCVEALQMVLDWDGGNAGLLREYAAVALDAARKARGT